MVWLDCDGNCSVALLSDGQVSVAVARKHPYITYVDQELEKYVSRTYPPVCFAFALAYMLNGHGPHCASARATTSQSSVVATARYFAFSELSFRS